MVIPFQFEKQKLLSTKFGYRLILMWPFSETNAAAMRTLKDTAYAESSAQRAKRKTRRA
jgi:hypothetical protein